MTLAALATTIPLLAGAHLTDLDVYRAGGHAVLHGHPLYDVRLGQLGFTYPPLAALVLSGLSVMSDGAAVLVITMLSLAALAVVLRSSAPELVHRVRCAPTPLLVLALVALVVCAPVRRTLWNGQIDIVLAALALPDVIGSRSARWRGVGIGLAAALKLTPALFAVYLVLRGRYRDAALAGAAFVVATALAWCLLPADSLRFWTHELFAGSGIGDSSVQANQSLRGVAERLTGTSLGTLLWAVTVVPVAAIGLRLAVATGRSGAERYAAGMVGVTACLISPVSWMHHWVWAIPWLICLAERAWPRGTASRLEFAAVGFVFLTLDRLPPVIVHSWWPTASTLGNGFVLTAVLVWAVGAFRVRRPAREPRTLTESPQICKR